MNISSANAVSSSVLQKKSSASSSKASTFSDALAQATRRSAAVTNSAQSTTAKAVSRSFSLPSLWLNGVEDASPVNLLLDMSEYKARRQNGRADEGKPNVAEFMAKTGVDAKEASKLLYGSLGAIPDMRDWTAIMASDNPAIAARQATAALINSDAHASYIGESLKSAGYKAPADTDIVAKSGNLAVLKESAKAGQDAFSLRIIGASGHIVQSAPWSADEIALKMRDYGLDISSLGDLTRQMDTQGLSYAALKLT